MSFTEHEERTTRYSVAVQRNYSEQEMRNLDDELEKFRVTKEVSYPEKKNISYCDEKAWLISQGALNKDGDVIIQDLVVKVRKTANAIHSDIDCEPILYEDLVYKLEAWNKWKGRKQYGEKMRMIDLEKLAQEKTVKLIEITS